MDLPFLNEIVNCFSLQRQATSIEIYGAGLINDTYLVRDLDGPFALLQRLNPQVFHHPVQVMENITRVVNHAHTKKNDVSSQNQLIFPAMYSTTTGLSYVKDDVGCFWRLQEYIRNAISYNEIRNTIQAKEVGRALGCFHTILNDIESQRLHHTLDGFHVTSKYLDIYLTIKENSTSDKNSKDVTFCKQFIRERQDLAFVLENVTKRLKARVIHGDPKLNNFLFDKDSGKALSLIDLDTLMPGFIHYDIGDCVRSVCNTAGENPKSSADIVFDMEIFRAFIKGYMHVAQPMLTEHDKIYLYDCIRLLPFELGLRFFTDFLQGNVYFKVRNPNDNLQRALVQFTLLEKIENNETTIRSILQNYK